MIPVERLEAMQAASQSKLDQMTSKINSALEKIERLQGEANKKYSREYIDQQIIEERTKISDDLYKLFGEINENQRLANSNKRFYESVQFMLSRAKFSDDAGVNAAMKTAALQEYAMMDGVTLALTGENAKMESRYARLWCAFLAGQNRDVVVKIDIDVRTPEQAAGLRAISEINKIAAGAELQMRGTQVSPFTRKLSIAERANLKMQAAGEIEVI